jgi:hypothetical protein
VDRSNRADPQSTVLQKIESESTVKFDAPVATPKQIETVTEDPLKIEDISASKVAELEAKVRALEYQVKLYRAKEELKARATEKNTTSKLNPVLSSTAPLAANNSAPAPPAGVVESHTLKRKAGIHEHHQIEATVSRRPRGIPVPRVQRGSRGRGNNRGGSPSPRRGSSASAATVVDKDSSSNFPSFPWFG